MDSLRIILIVIAVLAVVGIWLADRWRRQNKRRRSLEANPTTTESVADTTAGFSVHDGEVEWSGESFSANNDLAHEQLDELSGMSGEEKGEELIIAITVMSDRDAGFSGDQIMQVVREVQLHFDHRGIFQFYPDLEGAGETAWFGVANVMKPGVFSLDAMADFSTRGLALFLQLPGPYDPVIAYDKMVEVAQQFAAHGGILCDERRQPLTSSQIEERRERVRSFDALHPQY